MSPIQVKDGTTIYLNTAGGEVITWSVDLEPNVIIDRELITGQNPRSDHPIPAKLIEALAD